MGYPSLVLGAIASFLEPFRGHLSPNIDNVSQKLTLRYPHEEPWVVSEMKSEHERGRHRPLALTNSNFIQTSTLEEYDSP